MKYTLLLAALLFFGAVQAQVPLSALGGQLTNGVGIIFGNAVDRIPSAVNTGAISLGFTTATALPVGRFITIALPAGYFSAADNTKANTFTTGGAASTTTASCTLTAGVAGTKVLGFDGADSLICTTATAVLAAGAQVLTLIAGAVTTGALPQAASTFNVATSGDRQLATGPATAALGGQLTSGVGISFGVASNAAPGTLSTGTITFGFTTATALPASRFITIALPAGYFSAADAGKANTFTTGGAASTTTASCTRTAGVVGTKVLGIDGADSLICTTSAVLAAGAQVLTLIAGAVTTGTPQAASTFNVATSADRQLATAPSTVALGGQLTSGTAIVFSSSVDRVPGAAASTDTVKIGFTTATIVPHTTGKITIALPRGYFSAADNTKVNTFTTDGSTSSATAKCTFAAGTVGTSVLGVTDAQTLTCELSAAGNLNAGVQVMTLIIGAVTAGASPVAISSYNVATSADRQLATAPATVALGGQLTAGAAIVFDTATDKVPATLSTGVIKIGFTTATAVPHTTGTITIALPTGYFSAADATKLNTFTTAGVASAATAKCVRTGGTAATAVLGIMGADRLVCTLEAANALAAGAQVMSLIAGAVTTGAPQAAATYNVATSQDLQLATAPATTANHQGGNLIGGSQPFWAVATDKFEGQLSSGIINISFTTITNIPVGGKITIALPSHYFSAADNTKVNTFTNSSATAKCTFTASSSGVSVLGVSDATRLVCTTETAALSPGLVAMNLIAGSVTSGTPGPAGLYNVATSADLGLVAPPPSGAPVVPGATTASKSRATVISTSIALLITVFVVLF